MEGNYYSNPSFPYAEDLNESKEEEIIEHETRSFKDSFINKDVAIYVSFNNSMVWRDKVFEGTVENVQDHFIILLSKEKNKLIIPINYINFIEIKNR